MTEDKKSYLIKNWCFKKNRRVFSLRTKENSRNLIEPELKMNSTFRREGLT